MIHRALRPTASLHRHVALRHRSKARETLYRSRRLLVASILSARPNCEVKAPGCTGRSECVDEILKRSRGGSILEPINLRAACVHCNAWIEDHPREALELGIAVPHAWEKP